ncbi:MAG: energy transducer TonB, partial [Nitrospirota bacterium]
RPATEQTQDRVPGLGGRRDLLDLKYQDYYSRIWERIRRLWVLPEGIVKDEGLMLVMTIRVKRDGSIEKYWIEQSSGNLYFDQSAIRTINKASPLPSLPKDLSQDTLDIGIRFFP